VATSPTATMAVSRRSSALNRPLLRSLHEFHSQGARLRRRVEVDRLSEELLQYLCDSLLLGSKWLMSDRTAEGATTI
jgi:hypothetical protein